jgi:poly-gamma-glutamate synthase PgsB/CapB
MIVSVILCFTICLLIFENWALKRNVNNLQLRIHVNGTRGKSSVTEYIAASIGNAKPSVMAKITGIVPTIMLNGEKQTIKRVGITRVQEQIGVIKRASRKKTDTLVMECMSISPELQRLESTFFRPHIYVITNIKDDHREEMGKTLEEQANSICSAIPENCIVVTDEKLFLPKIEKFATRMKSRVVVSEGVSQSLLQSIPDSVFVENVALALSVCKAAGIDNQLAEQGIMDYVKTLKSPLTHLNYKGKEILFLNAFAVNDVDSTSNFIDHWKQILGKNYKTTILFNTRADRPIRSDLFAEWIAKIPFIENVIVIGDHSSRAKRSLLRFGLAVERIHVWNQKKMKNFKENLLSSIPDDSLVVGVGNISGSGFRVINELI